LATLTSDMIMGINTKNGSCDPDHAPFRVVCYPSARIWYCRSFVRYCGQRSSLL